MNARYSPPGCFSIIPRSSRIVKSEFVLPTSKPVSAHSSLMVSDWDLRGSTTTLSSFERSGSARLRGLSEGRSAHL